MINYSRTFSSRDEYVLSQNPFFGIVGIICRSLCSINWSRRSDLQSIEIFRFLVNQTRSWSSIPLRMREGRSLRRIITTLKELEPMTSIRLSTKQDSGCLGGFAYEQANMLPSHPLRL